MSSDLPDDAPREEALAAYRRAVLVLAAAGALSTGVVGMLPWTSATVAAVALLVGARTRYARPAAVLGGIGLVVGSITAVPTPTLLTGTGMLLVLLVLAARGPRRPEWDAALVAAAGIAVLAASTGSGWRPALPLAGCTALLVAALWHRQRAAAEHQPRRAQRTAPRSLVAATAAVGALGMLALPTTGTVGLHSTLFSQHLHGPGTEQSFLDPAGFSTDTLSLDARGQLSDEPVLAVSANAPELWRGDVYATYDGSSWQVPATGTAATGPMPTVTGEGPSVEPVAASALDPVPPGRSVRVVVVPASAVDGETGSGFYAPGVVESIEAPGPLLHHSAGGGYLADPAAYAETVVLPVTDPARLAAARGTDPEGWTALPAELPQRVRSLAAQITAGAPTRAAAVAAVETYLRTHERYTLGAPVPRAGEDAVDDFLFESHEGFCEQFASAETVLLRSVGIPARLATGFAYGQVQADTGRRQFTAADAHAWVEVSYPGLGWSPSDPTAGTQLVAARTGLATQLHHLAERIGRNPALRAATAGVLALLLAGGTAVALRGRRTLRRRRTGAALGPVSAAFSRLEGQVPRAPAATPREYVASLPAMGSRDTVPDAGGLGVALRVWEAEAFGSIPPDAALATAAVRAVDTHRRALRRAHRRWPRGGGRRTGAGKAPGTDQLVAVLLLLVLGAGGAGVAGSRASSPGYAGVRAPALAGAACASADCLAALAAATVTPVLGPREGSIEYAIANPRAPSYFIGESGTPGIFVISTAASLSPFRMPGTVMSATTVRSHPGTAFYLASTGDHTLEWVEAGRRFRVMFPIEDSPAQARAEVTAWIQYG